MTIGSYLLFWGAGGLVFLLPGLFLTQAIGVLRRRAPSSERLLPAFLLSAGVFGLVYASALALHLSLGTALKLELSLSAFAALAGIWRTHQDRARAQVLSPDGGVAATRWVLGLMVAVFIWMLKDGGSLGTVHDSLDFVAFVHRMLLTDRVDLAVAAYPDGGNLAPDPRRAAFHLAAAFVCRLSGVAPTDLWRALPTLLAPLALWVFFVTTRRVLRSHRAAAFGTFAFALATLFDRDRFLQNLGYASRVGWVYSLVALWAVALWLDVTRADELPPPDWRPFSPPRRGRALLLVAALAAPILVGVHILSALQCLLALLALTWSWAFFLREPQPVRRTLLLLPVASGLALVPLLLLQVGRTYSSANPLFDHPQGLLMLGGPLAVLGPTALARWFGWPGLLGVIVGLLALRHARWDRGAAFLFGSTAVMLLVVLNPLAVAIVEKAKAHSVLFRVMYVAPIYPALGWLADWARARAKRPTPRRGLAVLVTAGIVLAFALQIAGALRFWGEGPGRHVAFEENLPLRRALAALDAMEADARTVASDPITSYEIPAYTRHYVLCPYNQHSSPADDKAIARTYDASAILKPLVSPAQTWRRIEAYDVRYVLLNQTYPRYFRSYLSFVSPSTFPAQKAKFDAEPDRYTLDYGEDSIWIYRVRREAGPPRDEAAWCPAPVVSGEAPPSRDSLRVLAASDAANRSREELARALRIQPSSIAPADGLELIGLVFADSNGGRYRPGGFVHLRSYWRQRGPVTLPVEAFLRAEAITGDAKLDHPLFGRLYRAWREARRGEVLRFGRMHQPLEVWYPPYLWDEGAVYRDDYWLPIPTQAPPGRYRLRVHLAVTPYAENLALTDLISVRDSFDGPVVDEFEVVAP
ncbi:MAG: hypothetical protein U0527_11555 [Candidatus Eisenbacteria bacterium]